MLFDLNILKQDSINYTKTEKFDRTLFGVIYGVFGLIFVYGTIKANASVMDLIMGPFFALIWTYYFIPIPSSRHILIKGKLLLIYQIRIN